MPKRNHLDDNHSSDGEEPTLVNIDFDFFNPAPIDFLSIKRLLAQLFQSDAELLFTHDLTELIIGQTELGTTVKTDGIDSDPYAFLSVLNMGVYRTNPAINALLDYLIAKAQSTPMLETLRNLFGPGSNAQVGLILSERLINMPVQVVPHMYRMLGDEMNWAIDENKPFRFTHYLCVSRTYEISSEEDQSEDEPPSKKLKSRSHHATKRVHSYHAEDDIWENLSLETINYDFSTQPVREPGATGARVGGKAMVLQAERYPELVALMTQQFATL